MAKILLLVALFSALSLSPFASAGDPYCDGQPFWLPDGTIIPGTNDWTSVGPGAEFRKGWCLGLAGIGATETYEKTILIIDRAAAQNGYITLPNNNKDLAYAEEINTLTGRQRGLDVITNTFCSSGQHMANGTFFSIGGDWSPDYAGPGEFSIRSITPCTDATCGFSIVGQLLRSRWYPTSILLPNGKAMIVGGADRGVGLTSIPANTPYIEYFPRVTPADGNAYKLDLLVKALPYNLFPFVYLLPSGNVFIFSSNIWTLWNTVTNAEVPGNYPAINEVDANGNALRFSYPTAGTAALFPLTSVNKYTAEIMICGGSSTGAIYFVNGDMSGKGVVKDSAVYPASNKCFRIFPEAAAPKWTPEQMKYPRVMPIAVILPNSQLLILCGTQEGHSGLGYLSHKASLIPEIYETTTHTWYEGPLAKSFIPRTYHSSAFLYHDSSVLITGSAPHANIIQGPRDFPTEFRSEFFRPTYMKANMVPPALVNAPKAAVYGSVFEIAFKYPLAAATIQVVLSQPGFSTHGANHGMRQLVLDVGKPKVAGAMHVIEAAVPANKNLIPATWYWLFVVVNGVPNREGHYMFIK